ncbi:MAG: hypothetical protein ABIJ75_10255 [Actinomycetota bacterium]
MAQTLTSGIIEQGYIASGAAASWYVVPAGTSLEGGVLLMKNINAAKQTVLISLMEAGGAAVPIPQVEIDQNGGARILLPPLGPADAIHLGTTTATAVHCTLGGTRVT